jgi:isocitrate dehydrogenase
VVYARRPALAMVDSRKGITNLHVPNDVIVDASMPNVIRDGGKMWNNDGELQDCIAMVPDRCYATMYAEILEDAEAQRPVRPGDHGQRRQRRPDGSEGRGVRLPRQDLRGRAAGTIRVVDAAGETLLEQKVSARRHLPHVPDQGRADPRLGRLAVTRARATGSPAVFWLDEGRAHDAQIIAKVKRYLPEHDTRGLDIRRSEAGRGHALHHRAGPPRRGHDLGHRQRPRDYLTDLFPILELGTSARMLSIVPLMEGGGLFETGAGGSAPKHVQQFLKEGHLRWDSLGEYCALVPSLELVAERTGNPRATVLADTLDQAVAAYLENGRLPSRKVHEIDNRGGTFYLALYWAQALAAQEKDPALAARFAPVAETLAAREAAIAAELLAAQGRTVDLGGYYLPEDALADKEMRPSATLNAVIDGLLDAEPLD